MLHDDVGWVSGAVEGNSLLTVGNDEGQDGWAPLAGERVCEDGAGRWRPEHIWDKDGGCIFCPERIQREP